MSVTEIWRTSPGQLRGKHVKQIIAFAGDGRLGDGSDGSLEFREFLSLVPSGTLSNYADECLGERFPDSGFALQDVVNELGRRLGFTVEDGRYRGAQGAIGYDGVWRSPSDHYVVVEVKTSDVFRVDLENIATFRKSLIRVERFSSDNSSILIVVGSEDTRELEAQIRGSRHAWDIRLISVEGLKRLVHLKEELDDPATVRRIGEILIPYEYTRVDRIIDLVFSTTEEVLQEETEAEPREVSSRPKAVSSVTEEPKQFNAACALRVSDRIGTPLLRRSRTLFTAPDQSTGVICLVSKEHQSSAGRYFWYGYHDYQREVLEPYATKYVAFGCGSPAIIVLVPANELEEWLPGMNTTATAHDFYRHVQIFRDGEKYVMHRKRGEKRVDVSKYLLPST
jgi:hypothetical protein